MRSRSLRGGAYSLWCSPLLDALLPQTCAACDSWIAADTGPICTPCRAALCKTAELLYCEFCGRTMPSTAIHEKNCASCRKEQFWNVAGIVRIGMYREPALRQLLLGLKFGGVQRQAEVLGELLADAMRSASWIDEIEALIPVPMHLLRRVQRPCDHANMLAKAVARRLKIPVLRAVRRDRYGESLSRVKSQSKRFDTIKACFIRAGETDIAGKTVCIIDNLLVTGATIHEVSKVLRQAGAKRIYAAVAARASL